ncbi:IPTL-CTERM sorting domain-containing protein [Acidovorax sp. MR-S7]|uniref:IPTL-CTERM sorting domain-containing protein n=1 Tax=Acidovorax sp. MR-S7 TaxID=1268622 RepID=UPI00037DE815|nr:IPTL-CTERM sorting domain-containing protein [Acidovorax sp. MR-S7]GAD23276.1 hypothetical protein AVS7_03036 [Acidovorax sp. MR-S7]
MPQAATTPRNLLAAAALAVAAASAGAAPFFSTYENEIASSGFPEILAPQAYSVTLVFDNGSNSAVSQTWTGAQLTCVIWRMNDAQNVVFAQNLAAAPPSGSGGPLRTNASGQVDNFFTALLGTGGTASHLASHFSGFNSPVPTLVGWYITGANPVFTSSDDLFVNDFGGGVSTFPGHWSNPAPFTGACPASAATPAQPTAVPTLSTAGLGLMAALVGALGWRTRRRNGT